jgi:hypothetical protein
VQIGASMWIVYGLLIGALARIYRVRPLVPVTNSQIGLPEVL